MDFVTVLAIVVRTLIALLTRTFFQPDEYFQSIEPAHRLVFGYGHLTWEWLSPYPIRSILYPALNVPVYWILKLTGLDNSFLLIACPKLLHGVFAAATDVWVYELAKNVLGRQCASTALFISLTSFFHALALSRSLSNSLETSLTTIAFAYYPWNASDTPGLTFNRLKLRKTLAFAALACAIRPTNAVIWVYLFATLLWRLRSRKQTVNAILCDVILIGTLTIFLLFILDSLFYNKPTLVSLNFVRTNLSAVSLFYGSNPWHYYLSQALPILCTTALPFALHGIWLVMTAKTHTIGGTALRTMLGAVAWSVVVYSMAGHKEWRFIHPLLPLLHIFAAKSLMELFQATAPKPITMDKTKHGRIKGTIHAFYSLPIRATHLFLLLLNIPASIYVIAFYCSAPVSVISYLRALPPGELAQSVGFLMPCHSTPWQAYLHSPEANDGRLWALGCEPPLSEDNVTNYRDQMDVFYNSPLSYLLHRFPVEVDPSFPPSPFPSSIPGVLGRRNDEWAHCWPKYFVLFGALLQEDGVKNLLEEKGYGEVWKGGRTWEGEGKRKGGVRAWKYLGRKL